MRNTVYLIAQPTVARNGHLPDLSPLREYGDVVVVSVGAPPSFNPGQAFQLAKGRLQRFDPEWDYLVWAGGDTLSAVMVGAILVQQGHQYFRWLRFERGYLKGVAGTGSGRVERDDNRGSYSVVEVPLFDAADACYMSSDASSMVGRI